MKTDDLKKNPKNPRKITDSQLKRLKKSLDKFGDLSGFVVNRTTGNLVSGHQRREALKGAEIIIEEKFDEPTSAGTIALGYALVNGERFRFREVLWDETMETAALLAANKHSGDWYFPELKERLLELDTASVDFDLTGFDMNEVVRLLAPEEEPKKREKKTEDKVGNSYNKEIICPDCGHHFEVSGVDPT